MITVYIADIPVSFIAENIPIPRGEGVMYSILDTRDTFLLFFEPLEQKSGIKHLFIHHPDPEKAFRKFSDYFHLIEAAGGIVKEPGGGTLLIFRNGKWDLPKGKIEKGEEKKAAALREVEEECGLTDLVIDSDLPCTYHMYPLKGEYILKKTYWYTMKVKSKQKLIPQKEEGITQARWMDAEHIRQALTNTFPSVQDLLLGKSENS
jgi:8-oxo-dGTP pyrophosphatase MutT (NUDIX family)